MFQYEHNLTAKIAALVKDRRNTWGLKMAGIVYGVGVGPGDPELMTLKAVRLIKESSTIAVSGKTIEDSTAYKIALSAVPEIACKELMHIRIPMVKDRVQMTQAHRRAARRIGICLEQGRNVVYLTLGDPTIYCSFGYIARILESEGYTVEFVSGVSSLCAVSARLRLPLAEWDEPLHIIPAAHKDIDMGSGTYVFMKAAGQIDKVKEKICESGRSAGMVENCGMANERVYEGVKEMPDITGYYSTIIVK